MSDITWLSDDADGLTEPSELEHTANEDWALDVTQFTANASLLCEWDERHAVMYDLLSNARAWPYHENLGGTDDGDLMRAIGGRIKPYTGQKSIAVSGFPGGLAYDKAQLDLDFKVVTLQNTTTKALYQESLSVNNEMLKLPHQWFQWGEGAYEPRPWRYNTTPKTQNQLDKLTEKTDFDVTLVSLNPSYNAVEEDEAPSRLLGGFDYTVNWFNLSHIPAAIGYVNTVNQYSVYSPSLNFTFAPQTLRLEPAHVSRTVSFGGANRYSLEVRFAYRVAGWNSYWRLRSQSYEQFYFMNPDGADSDNLYLNYPPTSAFTGLLP